MHITGVQAVGGRGYVALAPVVVDTRQLPTSTASEAGPTATHAARLLSGETVVFPREGASIDRRPAKLKYERAVEKYREQRPRSRR
jgi:hypothetical protein